MSQPITAISNLTNIQALQGIHPAWLEAGYGIASSTPTYYNWQTLLTDLPTGVMPRQSLDSLPAVDFNHPRTALPAQPAVQQPAQQPASAVTGVLPQVPAGATGNGASAELNQLLNSTGTLASDVVAQSALLEQARKQVEQQKLLQQQQQQQQQMQVNQLQQQNAILAQQVSALKQQVITPTNVTVPLASGGVASSNPYLVGLGTVGSYPNASSLIYPANQLYSPGFSTAGMGVTPSTPPPQTTPAPTTAPVSSTPTPTAITGENNSASSTTPTKQTGVTGDTIADMAKSMLAYNSRDNAPKATNKGRLACAWFVNEVLKKTHGKTFPESGIGILNVDATIAAMKSEGAKEVSASELKAGDIVYVPGKHIGIVADDGGKTLIHNSSSKGESHQTTGSTFPSYKGQTHKYIRLA